MIERKLIRMAIAIGAAVWLLRLMVSRTERSKLETAEQALDTASFRGVNGLDYQQTLRDEWTQ